MALSFVARALRAATELRAALEAAATADEREVIARLIAELVGGGVPLAELAAEALATTFGTPVASSPPPSVRDAAGVPTSRG